MSVIIFTTPLYLILIQYFPIENHPHFRFLSTHSVFCIIISIHRVHVVFMLTCYYVVDVDVIFVVLLLFMFCGLFVVVVVMFLFFVEYAIQWTKNA